MFLASLWPILFKMRNDRQKTWRFKRSIMSLKKSEHRRPKLTNFLIMSLIIAYALVLSSLGLAGIERASYEGGKKPGSLGQAMAGLKEGFLADPNFASHLPLVVLRFEAKDLSGEGWLRGQLKVIDSPGLVNRLADNPALEMSVKLKKLEDQAEFLGKERLEIQSTDSGLVKILDFPKRRAWILVGSTGDPAMLRNYLGYSLGRVIIGDRAPRVRYCEVFLESEAGLAYQGLFLLAEKPSEAMGGESEDSVLGMTYIPKVGAEDLRLSRGQLQVLSVEGHEEGQLNQLVEEILSAQVIIGSDDPEIYFDYQRVLDVPSSINTYILNELMMNYQEEGLAVNIFPENSNLRLEPVWNFDRALDNAKVPIPDANQDAARSLWLPHLFKSEEFVKKCQIRFYELFRGDLNPKRISDFIDETYFYLGPARVRDWSRWSQIYANESRLEPVKSSEGETLIRSTQSLEQEIVKIKRNIWEQNRKIRINLEETRWRPDLLNSSARLWRNSVMSLMFIGAFFVTVVLARKRS
jgi:hypothetical protein